MKRSVAWMRCLSVKGSSSVPKTRLISSAAFGLVLAAVPAFAQITVADIDFAAIVLIVSGFVTAAFAAGITLFGGWTGAKAGLSVLTNLISKAFSR